MPHRSLEDTIRLAMDKVVRNATAILTAEVEKWVMEELAIRARSLLGSPKGRSRMGQKPRRAARPNGNR